MKGLETNLADVASLRHKTYCILSTFFQYPSDQDTERLLGFIEETGGNSELTESFPYFKSLLQLFDSFKQLDDDARSNLRSEYIDTFQVGRPATPCPLYESSYIGGGGPMIGWVVSNVERSYVAGGFSLADKAKGDLPDHLGLELEYMSILCAKETDARDEDRVDDAASSLRLQRAFLHQHLLRWIKLVTDKLRLVTDEKSLYHQLADVTYAFVVHDGGFVDSLAEAGVFSVDEDGAS